MPRLQQKLSDYAGQRDGGGVPGCLPPPDDVRKAPVQKGGKVCGMAKIRIKRKDKVKLPEVRTGIYRIPTKAVFRKKYSDLGKSWNEVYGKKKCLKCNQHFQENEVYEMVFSKKHGRDMGQHIECPPKERKVKR